MRKRLEHQVPNETNSTEQPDSLTSEFRPRRDRVNSRGTCGPILANSITTKLEVFDWLHARNDKRIQKNPAGYLVESIRQNYAVPKGFEAPNQRAQRLQAEQEKIPPGRCQAQTRGRRTRVPGKDH